MRRYKFNVKSRVRANVMGQKTPDGPNQVLVCGLSKVRIRMNYQILKQIYPRSLDQP